MNKLLCIGYIAFIVVLAIADIGELPETAEPYPWYLPLIVFVVTATPAWLGYLAGKDDK